MEVGDRVSWNSSGGRARGVIRRIIRNGRVPGIPVTINGSEDDPAARIELLDDDGVPRDEFVGHKLSTLRLIKSVDVTGQIIKADDEQRMVWGWASVISEQGEPVVDLQGDVIAADDLVKATTAFMADVRTAKAMHQGGKVGEVLHSLPLTDELAKALGVEAPREGWIVGMKIHDDAIWGAVKNGTLGAFSIGGQGVRIPVEEAA